MSIAPLPVCDPASGVLIVSPNGQLRRELMSRVKSERWNLMEAVSGADALGQLEARDFQLLLLDSSLPDLNANEFQTMVRSQFPHLQILPLDRQTGLPLPSSTPAAAGDELTALLGREVVVKGGPEIISHEQLNRSVSPLPGMIGSSVAMQRVYHMAQLVARRDTTVLILGESGTGKDLVAQAIHNLSPRRSNPFVVINCAAIPEPLLEAELFGYTKGAFTGAVQSRIGRIHAAQGGTLFLDEIGELPLGLQSKLLRFLEQGEVQRLGSSDSFQGGCQGGGGDEFEFAEIGAGKAIPRGPLLSPGDLPHGVTAAQGTHGRFAGPGHEFSQPLQSAPAGIELGSNFPVVATYLAG